jgi:hypothetical protein
MGRYPNLSREQLHNYTLSSWKLKESQLQLWHLCWDDDTKNRKRASFYWHPSLANRWNISLLWTANTLPRLPDAESPKWQRVDLYVSGFRIFKESYKTLLACPTDIVKHLENGNLLGLLNLSDSFSSTLESLNTTMHLQELNEDMILERYLPALQIYTTRKSLERLDPKTRDLTLAWSYKRCR